MAYDQGAAEFIGYIKDMRMMAPSPGGSEDHVKVNPSKTQMLREFGWLAFEDINLKDSFKLPKKNGSHHMESPTREELDAKFSTIEARMDGRVASIEAKIDIALAKMEGSEKTISLIAEKAAIASQSAADSAARAGGLKSTLWITSITTVLSVLGIALSAYFGTQQSNIGIVQSTIAASESGKAMAATQAELKKQSEENAALLKQIQEQLKPPPTKPSK